MVDRWEILAVVVSLTSAWISFLAMRRADNANRRSNELADQNNTLVEIANELQERLLAIEEAREKDRLAALRPVRFELTCKDWERGIDDIIAMNHGRGTAFNVRLFVNLRQIGDQIDMCPPGESITVSGLPPRIHLPATVHIKWDEEREKDKSDTITLDQQHVRR
jgi:hypothetical protein